MLTPRLPHCAALTRCADLGGLEDGSFTALWASKPFRSVAGFCNFCIPDDEILRQTNPGCDAVWDRVLDFSTSLPVNGRAVSCRDFRGGQKPHHQLCHNPTKFGRRRMVD